MTNPIPFSLRKLQKAMLLSHSRPKKVIDAVLDVMSRNWPESLKMKVHGWKLSPQGYAILTSESLARHLAAKANTNELRIPSDMHLNGDLIYRKKTEPQS